MLYKVLCVDDETANLRLLERLFRGSYEVMSAASADEALELLSVHDFALIISDQRMPGVTGIEFLKKAAEMRRQTVRIMLTGYTDASTLVEAINSGVVYKYVTKPWVNDDLLATVKRALQHYETTKAQRQLQLQVERLQSRLKSTRDSAVEVFGKMLDLKDPQAREHAARVCRYASAIGDGLRLERPDVEQLMLAASLHEVALYNLPADLVAKNSLPTSDEYDLIAQNLEPGLSMLESFPDLAETADTLRFLYENFDGSGRPRGFAREQIPLHARIISVADAFDSMTAPRGERYRLTQEDALHSLRSGAGTRFDPEVVNVFCDMQRENEVLETEAALLAL